MKLSNKTLGIIAMIGAPFLFLEMCSDYKFGLANTPAAGLCDLVYMAGWMCSITGLKRQLAAGDNKHSKRLLNLNLVFLSFACIWNIWEATDPNNQTTLFRILDCFWPASNILLFITGIVIAIKGRLSGFSRYAPLIAGFWVGFAMLFGALAGGRNELSFYVTGGYSVVAWFLLGLSIYKSDNKTTPAYPSTLAFV
jgi:hypothetical protein